MSSNTRAGLGVISKYGFYVSVGAFFLFIFLTALHYTVTPVFSFTVTAPTGFLPIPAPLSQQTAFLNKPATSDISCNFVDVYPKGYTIGLDVYIDTDFLTTTIPRVLLYRSPTRVQVPATASVADISTLFPNSNIILYLDPTKNDLYASVLDETGQIRRSDPIVNVPLRKAFRITVVFSEGFLELYMNGEQIRVLPLPKKPVETPPTSYFFGPPSLVNQSIKIGTVTYWAFELPAKTIRTISSSPQPDAFFKTS